VCKAGPVSKAGVFVKHRTATAVKYNTMIVYRFEKNGIGPYIGNSRVGLGSFMRLPAKTKAEKKYKRYFEEILIQAPDGIDRLEQYKKAHRKKSYIYGCSSKKQLRAYFTIHFKQLFKEGYRIKRYKVPDEEVVDIVVEVAFPVKYHKLQTVNNINKRINYIR
jgi:hypothetical protein